jgi:DNA-binding NarL/FixJ family response regulator
LSHVAADPNLTLITTIVGLKIALTEGSASVPHEAPDLALLGQRSAVTEYDALVAVAMAASGDLESATARIAQTDTASSIESHMYTLAARAIVASRQGSAEASRLLKGLVSEARRRACLDALVLAYRSYPQLLADAREQGPAIRSVVQRTIELSHDTRLAAAHGLPMDGPEPLKALLTPREQQVLRLMAAGLGNIEIAEALVISHSTAKVHVHNVVRKLQAKSRLEAIRRFDEADLTDLN